MTLLFLLQTKLHGQDSLQIDGIQDLFSVKTDAFYVDEKIRGYYFCYVTENENKDFYTVALHTCNEYLTDSSIYRFTFSSKEKLLSAAFNGSDFFCIVLDDKKQILHHKIFNLVSKREVHFQKYLDDNSLFYLHKNVSDVSGHQMLDKKQHLLGDKGFFSVIPVKHNNNFSFDINIYLKGAEYKQFTYSPDAGMKLSKARFVGVTDSLLLFHVIKKKVLVNYRYESSLLAIEISTGAQAFEVSTKADTFNYTPVKVAQVKETSNFYLLGNYFETDDKMKAIKSEGLCMFEFKKNGEVITSKLNSWKKDVSHFLIIGTDENNGDTATDNMGYLNVHDFIYSTNGELFIIGEGYKFRTKFGNVAKALVIGGLNILTMPSIFVIPNTGPLAEQVVTDMVVLHVNKNLKIDDATVFAKKAHYAGRFDFDFCEPNPDEKGFAIGFRDYQNEKKFQTIDQHVIRYAAGKFSSSKITLPSTEELYRVLPGMNNIILIDVLEKKEQHSLKIKKLESKQ